MLVRQVLSGKGSGNVATIDPDMTVAEAARQLSSRKIGCLVVSADGRTLDGILSERDIVREIGRQGPGCLETPVRSMMTTKVVTCAPGDEGVVILSRMTEGRFRHMPVLEDGAMVGLISIGDMVKARLSELSMEKEALEGMIMGY